jgi:DNA-binding LacI/PurR family transcriptional regulator
MACLRIRTASEQVADYLRDEIIRGKWSDFLPGSVSLANELGVGHDTMEAAMQLLQSEGILVPQGAGRPRRIVLKSTQPAPSLRIQILLYQRSDRSLHYNVDLLYRLREAGHMVTFSTKSLQDLKMDSGRVMRYVNDQKADAWIVGSGSRLVLESLAQWRKPVFALFGRRRGLRIAGAGPDKSKAQEELIQRLVALGHRRIVIMAREDRRKPRPATFERNFLNLMSECGVPVGSYNLPDWEESPGGFQHCLTSLFAVTPPTALFIEEMPFFVAAVQHLASIGVISPRDVSLICDESDIAFDVCQPSVAHIKWEVASLVRCVVKWADNVARGRKYYRQTSIKATFCEGGTIGPAPS